jgi:putative phage-type endonuclease
MKYHVSYNFNRGEAIVITEEQRKERAKGIGGSDMPIILGLSNFMTPYQLYLEKIGEGEQREETEAQYWGNQLEALIRQEFEKRNGVTVSTLETIISPFADHMRGNIDGFIEEWNAVLEVKCSSSFMAHEWGEDGSDVIPMQYLVQVAHYCAVTNAESAYIAVLIGGNQYRQFKYTRDHELEMSLIDAANKFWECVTTRTPPDATTIPDLRLMFPTHKEKKKIVVDSTATEHLTTLLNVRKDLKELSAIEERCKFNIIKYMEDSEALVDESGKEFISYKANKKGSRTFLVKGI